MDKRDWYIEMISCAVQEHGVHNFLPVVFSMSQYTKQATTLMCSHCLQLINFSDIQELDRHVSSLETCDSV